MLDGLIEIKELHEILGYTDFRSVKEWCKKNELGIIVLGNNKYVSKNCLEDVIKREIDYSNNLSDKSNTPIRKEKESREILFGQYINT